MKLCTHQIPLRWALPSFIKKFCNVRLWCSPHLSKFCDRLGSLVRSFHHQFSLSHMETERAKERERYFGLVVITFLHRGGRGDGLSFKSKKSREKIPKLAHPPPFPGAFFGSRRNNNSGGSGEQVAEQHQSTALPQVFPFPKTKMGAHARMLLLPKKAGGMHSYF